MAYNVDYKQFIDTYLEVQAKGGSVKEVSEACGISKDVVSHRLGKLRSQGIILPPLRRINVLAGTAADELKAYVEQKTKPTSNAHGMKKPPII